MIGGMYVRVPSVHGHITPPTAPQANLFTFMNEDHHSNVSCQREEICEYSFPRKNMDSWIWEMEEMYSQEATCSVI